MKIIKLTAIMIGMIMFSTVSATEISNFKFGLVCPDSESKSPWICHETTKIKITGQSACTFHKKKVPCSWYGFSFKYKNHEAGKEISCIGKSSVPFILGNPDKKSSGVSKEYKYRIKLSGENGVIVNPQYTVYGIKNKTGYLHNHITQCFIGDEPVFKYEYSIIYPVR